HGAAAERQGGFDVDSLQRGLGESWQLQWSHAYAFLGRYYEAALPSKWARVAARLADAYPHDGANFCAVWRFRGPRWQVEQSWQTPISAPAMRRVAEREGVTRNMR